MAKCNQLTHLPFKGLAVDESRLHVVRLHCYDCFRTFSDSGWSAGRFRGWRLVAMATVGRHATDWSQRLSLCCAVCRRRHPQMSG